ncbi:unnamed protein product [Didymodactylos carnosus]|uniref:NAD(P)(+)--arginine ADP-ribosyltransferase n=1 Tax=Didymodactylos carnosus TaxID=1234261 RepID=A0A815HPB9_9BILA|nr:unnamed protein product [Didymodactylos carnosus]CAF4230914.1 unnamed protein product [Didymodactylos carnosus]
MIENKSYFTKKGLSDNEAQAVAFALSLYTGPKSETCNRTTGLLIRNKNGEGLDVSIKEEMYKAAVILYYLVKGLSYIPYYWGTVTRLCQLTDHELTYYMPEYLITWIQFSSSKKGTREVSNSLFKRRNTIFKIYSLTGRPIKQFSNWPEEDEVFFLPHSTFLISKLEVQFHGTQHNTYAASGIRIKQLVSVMD